MFRSMTAYSRKAAETDGRSVSVEIKSVNNKYLDLSVRMPRAIVTLEPRIRSLFAEAGVSRGKVDVNVSCSRIWGEGEEKTSSAPLVIDRAAAASYIAALKTLRDEFGLYDDISVMKVAENRDIFTVEGAGRGKDLLRAARYRPRRRRVIYCGAQDPARRIRALRRYFGDEGRRKPRHLYR